MITFTLPRSGHGTTLVQRGQASVVLPRAWAEDIKQLHLAGPPDVLRSHALSVLTRWPDQSIRSLHIDLVAGLNSSSTSVLRLLRNSSGHSERHDTTHPLCVTERPEHIQLQSEHLTLTFDRSDGAGFSVIRRTGERSSSRTVVPQLLDHEQQPLGYVLENLSIMASHPQHAASVHLQGHFAKADGTSFVCAGFRFTLLAAVPQLQLELNLHNPRAAEHPGGFWDLGDAGSVEFKDFSLLMPVPRNTGCQVQLEADAQWLSPGCSSWRLTQLDSGGDFSDSPVHQLADGSVPAVATGYRWESDGSGTGTTKVATGRRSTPLLHIEPDSTHAGQTALATTISVDRFWQECPAALQRTESACRIGLFPGEWGNPFELQGGERKTLRVNFDFDHDIQSLINSTRPMVLLPDAMEHRKVGLTDAAGHTGDSDYDRLITSGLCPSLGFKAKRERIDEYGWRHFGELYADHETWNQSEIEGFVSHYNNQYDPIYGFGRQFLLSGNPAWFELMDDLAHHVLDIDIYHTEEDRAEYNGGLFWHTDHYVRAHTCTHRTYSRAHRHGGSQGGGPGGEHCYTRGLALYYTITADERARLAVFRLARWITHFYEGDGTVLDQGYRFLKRDLKRLTLQRRSRCVAGYRYPLDRGVGNYINALLDCHELSLSPEYLARVERIIENTIGPADDIEQRRFDDVENTWYYSIFLQALIRYLDQKRELNQFDAAFSYACDTLLHYASWIQQHECPALTHPERLEYPNETWVAQDIRKCNILYAAWRYSNRSAHQASGLACKLAAIEYRDYVTGTLADSQYSHYTRILAILMQNHGPHAALDAQLTPYDLPRHTPRSPRSDYRPASEYLDVLHAWGRAFRNLSMKAERNWLRHRLPESNS